MRWARGLSNCTIPGTRLNPAMLMTFAERPGGASFPIASENAFTSFSKAILSCLNKCGALKPIQDTYAFSFNTLSMFCNWREICGATFLAFSEMAALSGCGVIGNVLFWPRKKDSGLVKRIVALPLFPARAVLPTRWMYCSLLDGKPT